MQKPKTHINNYLIKQLPYSVVFLNKKMEIIHASDKLAESFELSSPIIIGKPFFKIFTYLDLECQEAIKNSASGQNYQVEKEYTLNNKENCIWIQWTSSPWYDENENIIGVILTLENTNAAAKLELEFKKTKDVLTETTVTGKIGTWEYNRVNNELTWCNVTKKIYDVPIDYTPEIKKVFNFYKEGYSRATIQQVSKEALQSGKPWKEKLQIVTSKKEEIWVITTGKAIYKNNKIIGLYGTFYDVNELALSEIKSEKSENLFKTLIDHLPLNIFIKDINSKRIMSNKHDTIFCNVKEGDTIIGKDDFYFSDQKTAIRSIAEDKEVITLSKPILSQERKFVKKDGTEITLLVSKIPIKGDHNKVDKLIGFSIDISELKEKEKELQNLIDVTSLQNEKLINFAHIISHNLRSQTANFSMLLDFLVKETNEIEKKSIINMLINTSNKLLETLDTLNKVVDINTNVNIEKKPVCLNSKIKSVENNLFALFKKTNTSIKKEIPSNIIIEIAPNYLHDIIKNIFTNSIKYKHPDRDPVIKLRVKKIKNYTILSIEDNGLGIDLDKYGNKLFGMYKTFHTNLDARGIGLYITKNQIEAMNGKITVSSVVNKGTTFNIYFHEKD